MNRLRSPDEPEKRGGWISKERASILINERCMWHPRDRRFLQKQGILRSLNLYRCNSAGASNGARHIFLPLSPLFWQTIYYLKLSYEAQKSGGTVFGHSNFRDFCLMASNQCPSSAKVSFDDKKYYEKKWKQRFDLQMSGEEIKPFK